MYTSSGLVKDAGKRASQKRAFAKTEGPRISMNHREDHCEDHYTRPRRCFRAASSRFLVAIIISRLL
jgi:hypothetical protein